MDLTWDILIMAACLVLGIAFRQGKLADLVLGKDPAARARFREAPTLRFFSNLMFVLCACSLLSVAGGALKVEVLVVAGIILNLAVLVCGVVYFTKSGKFRK